MPLRLKYYGSYKPQFEEWMEIAKRSTTPRCRAAHDEEKPHPRSFDRAVATENLKPLEGSSVALCPKCVEKATRIAYLASIRSRQFLIDRIQALRIYWALGTRED
jgi:hypothetical protein